MLGSDTQRIVAVMTNAQVFRYIAEMQSPRDSVSAINCAVASANRSIAGFLTSVPYPTMRCLFHITPKPLGESLRHTGSDFTLEGGG